MRAERIYTLPTMRELGPVAGGGGEIFVMI